MWRSKPMLVNGGNLGLQCLRQIKTESVPKKTNVEIRQCLVLKSSMTAWREKVTFWQFLEKMQLMYVAQALSGAPRPSSMAGMKHQGLTRPWRLRDPSHEQLCYHSTVHTVWTTQVHFGCSEKTEKRDITSPFSIRGWRIIDNLPLFRRSLPSAARQCLSVSADFLQSSVCALARADQGAARGLGWPGWLARAQSSGPELAAVLFVTSIHKGTSISCMPSETREPL